MQRHQQSLQYRHQVFILCQKEVKVVNPFSVKAVEQPLVLQCSMQL